VRVLIAGGGTGGHLYPGIAVARELSGRDPSTVVSFVGTASGIESRIVPREGFPLDLIRVAGLKRKSVIQRVRGLLLLPLAAVDAWRVISRRRPDVVIGVGGFASGPALAIAALRRVPTLVLEQNAVPGVTNRLLAPFVDAAAVNFREALQFFPRTGFVAGNPVRPEFLSTTEANEAHDMPRHAARVLIVGGSQGAHAINLAMVEAAPRLAAAAGRVAITHQTGERDLAVVRAAYERVGLVARVEAFLDQVHREMKAADVVVCRAGATTLAEVSASGRPAILVPLASATDDHQRKNAAVFASAGAAMVIDERELDGPRLADDLVGLIGDRERRVRMGAAARTLAQPDAAARIADRVGELAEGRRQKAEGRKR
jgi:UDP-N-acetylglucosamine--N-acetylmuramyl-(pentapeptide) pyrophosphoryl-undecaprenol N-acetylglucosamine transferase